jgi:hypothetical protein
MEGNVQLSDNSGQTPESPAGLFDPAAVSTALSAEPPPKSWNPDQDPAPFDSSFSQASEMFDSGNFEAVPSEISLELEAHVQELEPAPVFEEAAFESQISDLESPMLEPFDSETESSTLNKKNPSDLLDVTQFSNADEPVGPLSYSILIEAIDTQDIRQQLLDALSDPKFQWDSKEMFKKIKMGKLILENLNPVKASILVHRLQALPVKVSWTQNVYS